MSDAYTIECEVEGKYGFGRTAWEGVYTGTDFQDAKDRLAEYRANEPATEFRLHRRRVPVAIGSI